MSLFERWRSDRQARREAQTETEFGLVGLAAIVNHALKTVQVSGYYRFRPEELDGIEGIITRYAEGVPAAIKQFFPDQHVRPWRKVS